MTLVRNVSGAAPPANSAVAARARAATKTYGKCDGTVVALDQVTVEFAAGAFTAIMGPSGSGKSTLMHCVAGLDGLTSGRVLVGATDLSTLNDKRLTTLRRD
ncbi:MAG TPA: ATP-binding cassette domain-containing protein, partial [Acidimicrobiia bacterium]|nr:ATP-binding cassette domain-containing protein [Acidimicrobiia bacterium]